MFPPQRLLAVAAVALLCASALAGCVLPWSPEGQNQRSGPGDDALLFIRNDPYPKLQIVVDYVRGYEPNEQALQVLVNTAKELLDKDEVTVVKHGDIPAKGDSYAYSFEEVNAIEKAHREEYHGGDTAVMYFLYLDGKHEGDTSSSAILGAAYHGSSLVMFKNNLRRTAEANRGDLPGFPGYTQAEMEVIVERAVLVHEMGHVLGLVDNGIPMVQDHLSRDPDHTPKHSDNPKSVMYYAVETSAGIQGLVRLMGNTDIPYRFDADDRADIEAAKNG